MNARLEGLLLQGRISTGKTSRDSCEFLSNLPERQDLDGELSPAFCAADTPFLAQVKLLGSYTFPYDIVFAGTLQSVNGPERSAIVTYSNAQIAPSLGRPLSGTSATRDINVVEPGTEYGR